MRKIAAKEWSSVKYIHREEQNTEYTTLKTAV
jgi:hypothetical protein